MKGWKARYGKAVQAKQQLIGRLALFIDSMNKRCARWLDRKVNPLPVTKKRWLLYIFCAVFALYSVWLLLSPFRTVNHDVAIRVEPMPFSHQPIKEKRPQAEELIATEQYNRIHAFKLYLDSLAKDTSGQKLYDSIIARHPGIKDSLQKIEDYYQLQK